MERVADALQRLRAGDQRAHRRRPRLQLAPAEASDRLTGFAHNAVSPFGMLAAVPVLVCSRLLALRPAYVFLGAGEVDLKLGLSVSALVEALRPIVVTISDPRDGSGPKDEDD